MSTDRFVHDPRFRPSAYTAGLLLGCLDCISQHGAEEGFEVGVGGGHVMAALLQAKVRRFLGVDILPDAVQSSRALLGSLGLAHRARVEVGSLWEVCAAQCFDLIVANLPQFPLSQPLQYDERPASWSDGGPDGRALIDPFVAGLGAHLRDGGCAVMTHNVFVDLARSVQIAQAQGLQVEEIARHVVPLSAERVKQLRAVQGRWGNGLAPEEQAGLLFMGEQAFAEFAVLKIHKPPAKVS